MEKDKRELRETQRGRERDAEREEKQETERGRERGGDGERKCRQKEVGESKEKRREEGTTERDGEED